VWQRRMELLGMRHLLTSTVALGSLLVVVAGCSSQSTASQATSSHVSSVHSAHATGSPAGGSTAEDPFRGLRFKRAETRYAACMDAHGVKYVPGPRTPVSYLKALAARNPIYRLANLACYETLLSANHAYSLGTAPSGAVH
jgi:hypothetical protein